jgi:hypothetical protein
MLIHETGPEDTHAVLQEASSSETNITFINSKRIIETTTQDM